MSNWNGLILTTKGQSLKAKVEADECQLELTKFKIGNGQIAEGQTLEGLTDLVSPKQVITINTLTAEGSVCKIGGVITNVDLEEGYEIRELGLFATDPDDGEILYAITIDNHPDYLQPEGSATVISEEFECNISMTNAANVTAVIGTAGLATIGNVQTMIAAHEVSAIAHADILHLRKPSTSYTVGDIAYSPLLPSWAWLECVVDGTTASGELPVPSSVMVNTTFADGSVSWRIRKVGTNFPDYTKTVNAPMFNKRDIITTSGTYTAPVNSWYKITVKGGGGGGCGSSNDGVNSCGGGGGGEGGTTIEYTKMNAGDTAVVVIGAGGTGGNIIGAGGSDGGDSSVTIDSNVYTAGGGKMATGRHNPGAGGSGTIIGCSGGGSVEGSESYSFGGVGGGNGGGYSRANSVGADGVQGGGGAGGTGYQSTNHIGGNGGNGYVWFEYFDSSLNQ